MKPSHPAPLTTLCSFRASKEKFRYCHCCICTSKTQKIVACQSDITLVVQIFLQVKSAYKFHKITHKANLQMYNDNEKKSVGWHYTVSFCSKKSLSQRILYNSDSLIFMKCVMLLLECESTVKYANSWHEVGKYQKWHGPQWHVQRPCWFTAFRSFCSVFYLHPAGAADCLPFQ